MQLRQGDYFKLSRQMRNELQTAYNFGKVDEIMSNTVEATLVEESEVPSDEYRMIDDSFKGKTFSFRLNEIVA